MIVKRFLSMSVLGMWVVLLSAQQVQIKKLSIEEMYSLAEANSRSIRTFGMLEDEAGQAVKVANNAKLPTVDLSLSSSYLGDVWISDRDYSNWEKGKMPHFGNNFALEASEIVYSGGVITSNIALAKLKQKSAHLSKEMNRQDIRFLLVGNYLEMYKLMNQTKVYHKNIEQTKKLLADIQAKRHEGVALKNDITRYELQLKSLELGLTRVENDIIILNNKLVTVLELPQNTKIEVDTTLINLVPELTAESDWQQTAVNQPVLQQSKLGVEESRLGEKIAKSEKLPSVSLFASNHFDGPITIEVPVINSNLNYWCAGVSVKFNIASLYKSDKSIRLAKMSTQRAIESDLLQQENVQTEVKSAYIRFKESFTVYDTQQKSLELASQNYSIINYRYLNGLSLITDMLDASNAKLTAELELENARINILFCYYSLKKASGTL